MRAIALLAVLVARCGAGYACAAAGNRRWPPATVEDAALLKDEELTKLWSRAVVVQDLKSRPELNERDAVCGPFRADRARFPVAIPGETYHILLSPSNLRCKGSGKKLEAPVCVVDLPGGKGRGLVSTGTLEPGQAVFTEDALACATFKPGYRRRGAEQLAIGQILELAPAKQAALASLYGAPIYGQRSDGTKVEPTDAELLGAWVSEGAITREQIMRPEGELLARGVRAFRTNAYNVGRAGFDPEDTPDLRKAVFAVTSRINHSCAPNCAPLPWPVRGHTGNSFKSHPGLDASAAGGWGATLVVIALRRILPGEELVTNYFDEVWEPRELRRKVLQDSDIWGISSCWCPVCCGQGDAVWTEAEYCRVAQALSCLKHSFHAFHTQSAAQ
ncbi:hypothetical protein T484DRAFT_1932467 [Baffinella frigidus]|nr:hypothetical protein T484DRAFT_1932467 [Cryptophyta sp. CCMP2293]|mmetsp:Transcript_63029/g.150354  ORF Transcript_63029/g.150354 Transcript_63029/m.150354 type:complete len:389 (+) Transcript_63029:72-1238(+)